MHPRVVVASCLQRHHLATGALSINLAKAKRQSQAGTADTNAVRQPPKAMATHRLTKFPLDLVHHRSTILVARVATNRATAHAMSPFGKLQSTWVTPNINSMQVFSASMVALWHPIHNKRVLLAIQLPPMPQRRLILNQNPTSRHLTQMERVLTKGENRYPARKLD